MTTTMRARARKKERRIFVYTECARFSYFILPLYLAFSQSINAILLWLFGKYSIAFVFHFFTFAYIQIFFISLFFGVVFFVGKRFLEFFDFHIYATHGTIFIVL